MENKPQISVITVCYNPGNDLIKTIDSVKRQTCSDFEYIVVDGGSKDQTLQVLEGNSDYIDTWISEPDNGIYNAMNKGARIASGRYLFFLNAGDIFSSADVLTRITSEISSEDLLYGKLRIVSKNHNEEKVLRKVLKPFMLKFGRKVSQQTVFIKKDMFERVSGLNEKYKIAADFDLLCKSFEGSKNIRFIDMIVCDYDDGGVSSNLRKSYDDTLKVIYDRYGRFYAMIYFIITRIRLFLKGNVKNK